MKPEQRFWRNKVQPAFAAMTGVEYERVELRTGKSGMPDVYYTCKHSGWIELKWSVMKPEPLDCTLGNIDLNGWDTPQRRWAKRHCAAGATVFLLIGTAQGSFLIDASLVVNCDSIHITSKAVVWHWPGKIDPAELKRLLRSRGQHA